MDDSSGWNYSQRLERNGGDWPKTDSGTTEKLTFAEYAIVVISF